MTPGLHTLPLAEYLALPYASSGLLHDCVALSPMHAKYNRDNPKASKEMDAGSVAHAILLEGNESCIVVCDYADWRTNAAKEQRDLARASSKYPILAPKLESIRAMVKAAEQAVDESAVLRRIWNDSKREVTCVWDEGASRCKARFDLLADESPTVVDYKTSAASVNPSTWVRHVLANGLDIQAALHLRALGQGGQFFWLAQENEPPYAACVMSMDPALEEMAMSRTMRALSIWQRCIETGRYPGYPTDVCYLTAPAWAQAEEETQRLEMEYDEKQAREGLQA